MIESREVGQQNNPDNVLYCKRSQNLCSAKVAKSRMLKVSPVYLYWKMGSSDFRYDVIME